MPLYDDVIRMLEADPKYMGILSGSGVPAGHIDAAVREFTLELSQGFEMMLQGLRDDPVVRRAFLRSAGVDSDDK